MLIILQNDRNWHLQNVLTLKERMWKLKCLPPTLGSWACVLSCLTEYWPLPAPWPPRKWQCEWQLSAACADVLILISPGGVWGRWITFCAQRTEQTQGGWGLRSELTPQVWFYLNSSKVTQLYLADFSRGRIIIKPSFRILLMKKINLNIQ